MMRHVACPAALMFVVVLLTSQAAQASSASFTVTRQGGTLKTVDDSAEIPRYETALAVGETVTLVAQGIVYPRGAAPQPSEADAANWLFDDEAFQLEPSDKKSLDKTKSAVSLKALKPGKYRARFVGSILGYAHKYDVILNVSAPK